MSRSTKTAACRSVTEAMGPMGVGPRASDRPRAKQSIDPEEVSSEAEVPDRLMPAAKVAFLFGVVLRTLSNWERRGILIPVRRLGYRYYRVSDVMRLLGPGCE